MEMAQVSTDLRVDTVTTTTLRTGTMLTIIIIIITTATSETRILLHADDES
jgi:hypothetical protein